MAKKKKQTADLKKAGHYAFIAGLVLAVALALFPQLRVEYTVWTLVVLGVIVGLLNVTAKETTGFLVAALSLIIASSASYVSISAIWSGLSDMLVNVVLFVSPAAIVVAIKTIISLAKD
ncbi:hypothetical protein GF336_00905 [Candidatus Woesearchaeota archaeon]|nr:hypothetical protein [Candidatus Woesearchaeota archaeon]